MTLRLVQDDGADAASGLATDEMLARTAGEGSSLPTLRLYTYRDHAALVGRFQTVEHEVRVPFCQTNGIAINRRPTGGGAILMGRRQLGIALALKGRTEDNYSRARELMSLFSLGLVQALAAFGINASFRRKNDLEVDGRKIAGLGMYRDPSGGLLFHASLLVGMEVPLMLSVLSTPFEKISDKEIKTVEARISTMDRELHAAVPLEEVRAAVAAAYERVLGMQLQAAELTPAELSAAEQLASAKYRRPDWTFQPIPTPDAVGTARVKTPAGLVEITACLAGETLKAAHVRGDFFAAESALADLEGLLRWHPVSPDLLRRTLEEFFHRHETAFGGIAPETLLDALLQAVHRAALVSSRAGQDPYGCFVTPGAHHAV